MALALLFTYSVGAVVLLRMSRRAHLPMGVVAATVALLANILGVVFDIVARVWAAPAVLILGAVAASRAFRAAEDRTRDTDEERWSMQTGMGLVGLALAEGAILLVAGLVSTIN